ncbi:MAG: HAMP domain-containing protein [Arcobacter sp.]|nr:HAMP domain-containing protein [Arcobacter sp.]
MKNTLFSKIFITFFLTIFIILSIFIYQAIIHEKRSILDGLISKAKNMSDILTLANTDAMLVDDEIEILEFVHDFVKFNKDIESFVVSRKNGNKMIFIKNQWRFEESNLNNIKDEKITYEIISSRFVKKDVFHYTYPVYFSGVKWGWFNIELSLTDYNNKISGMYERFLYLVCIIIISLLLISYLIAEMISKPIVKLNNLSNVIISGDLTKRVNIHSDDEIGMLSRTFNKMIVSLAASQQKLQDSHNELENRVIQRTKELNELNETLEQRVSIEIKKQQEQEQLLIQQSKLASMGEMIGNIAHQWRQPLNALGLVVQNISFAYELDELDDDYMKQSVDKVNLLTKNMSKTIDDFRNFFKPNKERESFDLKKLVHKTMALVEATFDDNNIKTERTIDENIIVFGFPNEYSQTLLNILSNSKDALLENNLSNPIISINVYKENNYGVVSIEDNGSGVPEDIIDKIFDPYFTTKEEGKGTGIGLYMSKIIIEQNMNGKLEVKNISKGAIFTISIPLYKGDKN